MANPSYDELLMRAPPGAPSLPADRFGNATGRFRGASDPKGSAAPASHAPAITSFSGQSTLTPGMRPKILLVFLMRFEESARMLQGIAQHERSHRQWATFLDDEAVAVTDPSFLRG